MILLQASSRKIVRAVGGLVRVLVWVVLGLMLLLALSMVSLRFPAVSRLVSGKINGLLAPTFQGQLLVVELGQVDFDGVSAAAVEVHDPAGRTVLVARGIDVQLFWPAVAYHALIGSDPLRIPIQRVRIGHLDVTLIDDGTGSPTLVHALEPREVQPADPSTVNTGINVDQLELRKARVTGALAAVPQVDVELSNLNGRLRKGADGLAITLRNLEVQARQLPTVDQVGGRLEAELWLPAEGRDTVAGPSMDQIRTDVRSLRREPPERRLRLAFHGNVAGSGTELHMRWVGQELLAELRANELTPATLERLVPALAPTAPVELTAKAEGRLQNLGLEAQLEQAGSRISARGRLRSEDDGSRHASLHLDMTGLDLSRLLASAPHTQVALTATASLDSTSEGSHGRYRLLSVGSRVAGEDMPPTTLEGELQMPASRPLRTSGTLDVAEPGAATHLTYTARLEPEGLSADLFSSTQLARAPRLRNRLGIDARGRLELRAKVAQGAKQIDAEIALDLRDVRQGALGLGRLEAHGSAQGDLRDPELRVRADGYQMRVAGRTVSRVWLSAQGTTERAALRARVTGTHPDRIELAAQLAPRSDRQIRSARLRVCTGPEEMRLRAASIGFSGGRLRVDRLTLDGPGNATLSLRYGRALEQLDLTTRSLDAARVLKIAGIQSRLHTARADLELHLSSPSGRATGTLVGDLHEITYGELRGSVQTNLKLEHDRLNGQAELRLAPGGATQVALHDVRLPLGGRPLRRFSGDIALRGVADLWQLRSLLPLAGVERAQGLVRYGLNVFGDRHGGRPAIEARVQSRSLLVVGQRVDAGHTPDAKQAHKSAPWSIRGVDVNLFASLERGVAKTRGELFDLRGELLDWNASWRELPRILRSPSRKARSCMHRSKRSCECRRALSRSFPRKFAPARSKGMPRCPW